MEAQPTVGSQQRKRGIFPQWVRYVVLTIMVIAILVCGVVWLKQVWGHLSDTFAALFGIGGVLVSLLALPFFYSSHESEAHANSGLTPQVQNTININFSGSHQSSSTEDSTSAPFSVSVNNEKQSQSPLPAQYTGTYPSAGLEKPASKLKNVSSGAKLQLNGRERLALRDALFNAYPVQGDFDTVFQANFDEPLSGYVNVNQNYKNILFDLITIMESRGRTRALIKAAYDSNPDNEMLKNFYLKYVKDREAEATVETDGEVGQTMPENMDEHGNNSEATIESTEEQLPSTRRGCIVEAQRHVKKAYDLLNPKLNILPENVADAIQYLKTVKRNIEQLRALLRADPPPKYARIFAEIDIVIDQIDNRLVSSLQPASPYKNAQNKFQTLRRALDNLDMLIPR